MGANVISKTKVSVLQGTVASGGTIPLPSGYVEAQCKWMVSVGSQPDNVVGGGAIDEITFTATATRVVTATSNETNWVNGTSNTAQTGTANYIIIGVK